MAWSWWHALRKLSVGDCQPPAARPPHIIGLPLETIRLTPGHLVSAFEQNEIKHVLKSAQALKKVIPPADSAPPTHRCARCLQTSLPRVCVESHFVLLFRAFSKKVAQPSKQ